MDYEQSARPSKKRFFIIVLIALALILVIAWLVWWFWFRPRPTPTVTLRPEQTVNRVVLPSTEPPTSTAPAAGSQLTEVAVVARNFVERFGSYSNQSDYQNIKDLYPQMTSSFRQSLELTGLAADQPYSGVDTKVLSIKIDSETASTASLTLSTQRWQREASLESKVVYQQIKLQLVKSGDSWLINQAQWQ